MTRVQRYILMACSLTSLVVLPLAKLPADDFAPRTSVAPDDFAPRTSATPAENAGGGPRSTEGTSPSERLFEPAMTIATVGDEHIQLGDVLPNVNQALEPFEGKIPPGELEKQRTILVKKFLVGVIDTKLCYLDFLRLAPPEKVPMIQQDLHKKFDANRVPDLLERAKVDSPVELDAKLRSYGSSLSKSRRLFTEQVLAHSMVSRNVKQNPEVTHEEMLAYYRDHKADYEVPARVRWEELMAEFGKFPDRDGLPSRNQAYAAISAMGNEVLRGAKFDVVAKRGSHGFTAEQGGYHDWTTKGSLLSKAVDEAIFTLPEGKLSQIIEDERGVYIVRVIERKKAGFISFVEAQVEIKEEIVKKKQDQDRHAYLDRLRKRTPVSTIFDEEGAPLYDPSKISE